MWCVCVREMLCGVCVLEKCYVVCVREMLCGVC
jgi:hypothetical protein